MADRLFLVLAFHSQAAAGGSAANSGPGVRLALPLGQHGFRGDVLLRASGGEWRTVEAIADPSPADRVQGEAAARLKVLSGASGQVPPVALVPARGDVLVNGIQPLGLKVLQPGDLVSAGGFEWVLLRRYVPEIAVAPPEVASSSCPWCGIPLSEAPVCRCRCGTYYHLQDRHGDPNSDKELQCYNSTAPCIVCNQPKSFEEAWIPSPQDLHL